MQDTTEFAPLTLSHPDPIRIALATEADRAAIYRLRHTVYAEELGQHARNAAGMLSDALDAANVYVIASHAGQIAGFVSVTLPGGAYSIDKYLDRRELPFPCDDGLYEVRLLTVRRDLRQGSLGGQLAGLLMYAAFRWAEARGCRRVVAIGRREVLGLYRRIGLQLLGREIRSGAVRYELMTATAEELRRQVPRYEGILQQLEPRVEWRLDLPYRYPPAACPHGGAFFDAIGDAFDALDRRAAVINADVLDAWFPPAPAALAALQEHLPWLVRTSPPADAGGLVRTIARVRGVLAESVLSGAGSSDLIFRALRHWLSPASRVLILDPTYGEYAHVCARVVGCGVERLPLRREDGYRLDPAALTAALAGGYDLLVLVNPNNPTGQHVPRADLEAVLRDTPARTRVWVDEAYVDYAGAGQSLEGFAAASPNVVVCKSLSKGYALSGVRAAYLCGAPALLEGLRPLTPPWVVSLPAQVAAVFALQDPEHYTECYRQTHALRGELVAGLRALGRGLDVIEGVANFVLCHLPEAGPDAATVVSRCRRHGLFLRDAGAMGTRLGRHALRLAVKDAETQQRMLDILARAW